MSDEHERTLAFEKLVAAARVDDPSPARLSAVLTRLEGQLGPLDPAPLEPAPPEARPAKTSLGAGLAIGGVFVLIAALLLWPRTPDALEASPAPVPVPVEPTPMERAPVEAVDEAGPVEVPIEVAPIEVAPEAPREEPVGREAVRRRAAPSAESIDDPGSELRAEMALLERAMTARDRGDLDAAREALAAHRSRFPEGRLSPDRERLSRQLEESASPTPLDDTSATP